MLPRSRNDIRPAAPSRHHAAAPAPTRSKSSSSSSSSTPECIKNFGIASFLLLASSAWLITTVALNDADDLVGYSLYAMIYGGVNAFASCVMIVGSMKHELLDREVCKIFTLASFVALALNIFNGVSVGLITFDGAGFQLPAVPPRVLTNGTPVIGYRSQQWWSSWSVFITGFIALMAVSEQIKFYDTKACPAGIVTFLGELVALIGILSPFHADSTNAQTGLIVLAVSTFLAIPLCFAHEGPVTLYRKLHSLSLMGLAVAMFAYLKYTGPFAILDNAFFGLLIGALSSIWLYASLLYV